VFPSQKADNQVLAAATGSLLLVVVSRRWVRVFFGVEGFSITVAEIQDARGPPVMTALMMRIMLWHALASRLTMTPVRGPECELNERK